MLIIMSAAGARQALPLPIPGVLCDLVVQTTHPASSGLLPLQRVAYLGDQFQHFVHFLSEQVQRHRP